MMELLEQGGVNGSGKRQQPKDSSLQPLLEGVNLFLLDLKS